MTTVELTNDITVSLVHSVGRDATVVQAARVSLQGTQEAQEALSDRDKGLIGYLVKSGHGSTLEHAFLTFAINAPIYVAREHMRHRSQSYNEVSGRYAKLKPRFYAPPLDRRLVNVGTSARPEMAEGTVWQHRLVEASLRTTAQKGWDNYEALLEAGVANEIARAVLPVSLMTEYYASANLRAWLAFLALRTQDSDARLISRPQWEIEQVARQIEDVIAAQFPVTYSAWASNGRG